LTRKIYGGLTYLLRKINGEFTEDSWRFFDSGSLGRKPLEDLWRIDGDFWGNSWRTMGGFVDFADDRMRVSGGGK
jgi:hypothetical protein